MNLTFQVEMLLCISLFTRNDAQELTEFPGYDEDCCICQSYQACSYSVERTAKGENPMDIMEKLIKESQDTPM